MVNKYMKSHKVTVSFSYDCSRRINVVVYCAEWTLDRVQRVWGREGRPGGRLAADAARSLLSSIHDVFHVSRPLCHSFYGAVTFCGARLVSSAVKRLAQIQK